MKTILLSCLIPFITVIELNAQNYLISFTGAGASTTVTTVKVENLTAGTSLIIAGTDILRLTSLTAINTIDYGQYSGLKIYPNPMTYDANIQFCPASAGDAIISIYEMTGKPVARIKYFLENTPQEFHVSGLKNGAYIINVKGKNYKLSGKLLCSGGSNGTVSIVKESKDAAIDAKKPAQDSKGVQATIDMAYTTGDRLKFTGTSGNYSTVMTDIPSAGKIINFNFVPCTDADNINYPIVKIGTQTWMAENLRTTRYNNGVAIGTTTPATKDITAESLPKYQWAYDGNEANAVTYGRLYTWYTVTDSRNVCPTGWHLPSDPEWTTLTTYLGGENVAGSKLKETGILHWDSPNTGATNEVGFTALGAGSRSYDGWFVETGFATEWWSSSNNDAETCWIRDMLVDETSCYKSSAFKNDAFSVRCIKD